jgi:hypothetical protein
MKKSYFLLTARTTLMLSKLKKIFWEKLSCLNLILKTRELTPNV